MTFLRTSMFSAISSAIRIGSGFIITKIIAVYVGPSGLALVGQFQNFITIVLLFSGDFLKTATTKYTAEYATNSNKMCALWSSLFATILVLNSIVFVLLFLFSDNISEYIMYDKSYSFLLRILALSLPFIVLNTMLLAILNGQLQIRKYISINILLSIVSLILIYVLSINYGINGTLLAYILNQSVMFFITLFLLRNENWLKIKYFLKGLHLEEFKKILGFALITFTSVLASNVTLLFVRDFITDTISLQSAGFWQGAWTLSQVLLSFVTMSLVTYFLPTVSAITSKSAITEELKKVMIVVFPVSIFLAFCIYILRDFIIEVLYTESFLPMKELFLWQMIGTVIKISAWVFGYVLVAKAMVRYTVLTEILFAAMLIVLTFYLVNYYGLIGVTYAYTLNSFLHFLMMFYLYQYKFMEEADA